MKQEKMKTSKIITKAMVSGGGVQDTRTPLKVFKELNKEFDFELDPCTSSEKENNLGTPFYFTKKQDGLNQDWSKFKSIFINPPWAKLLNLKWINKAFSELEKSDDMTIVFLVPSKTETRWYQTLYKSKFLKELRFHKGRIKFEGHKGGFIFGISYFILKSEAQIKS